MDCFCVQFIDGNYNITFNIDWHAVWLAGPAAGKKGPAAKGAPKKDEKPPAKKWTPQDDAARKIQTKVRQFLAKAALRKLKKEKEDYHELMERLEKEVSIWPYLIILFII